MPGKQHKKYIRHRFIAAALGASLILGIAPAGARAEDLDLSVVLEDAGGDMPAETAVETDPSDTSLEVQIDAEDVAADVPEAEIDTPDVSEVEIVTPKEIGESIREIIQASGQLAEADADGAERLESYIEETKAQYDALPEEGQEVLQESIAALENAEVAVEAYQDALEQLEETGVVAADPNGLENSFRYLNGVPIDESLIAVEEEIEDAAGLDLDELFGEEESGQADAAQADRDPGQPDDDRDARTQAGPDREVVSEGSGADSADGGDGKADGQPEIPQSGSHQDAAEEENGAAGQDETVPSAGKDADTPDGLQSDGGEDDGTLPGGDISGTDEGEGSASGDTADSVAIRDRDLPVANVAVLKTEAGEQLVRLDDPGEVQHLMTASGEVHKGIDVSHHNGTINWDKVKAAGIEFAIIRCGHGHNLETGGDTYWLRNIREAERIGLSYGVYFYSYATTTAGAKKEAATTIRLLKGHKPSLPVFFDMEDHTQAGLSKSLKNNIASTYCDAVESAGYKAGFYSYKYWIEGYMSTFIKNTNYPIWVAQYASKTTYKGDYAAWQYSSKGSVKGISGYVDMNYWYGKLAAAKRVTGPDLVVETLNKTITLKPDAGIAQMTSADKYTQKQVSPGKWIIVENATGKQLYGFVNIPSLGKICYFDKKTGYKLFGQQKIDGKYYLFDETTGAMQVGFRYLEAQNKIVYFNAKGQMVYDKQHIGGSWFYFNPSSGAMKRSGFQTLGKKKCYYDEYGRAVSGEKKIGKYYYYFNPKTYAMKTGLQKVAGTKKTCYYNKKGRRQSGLKKIKGKKYYFKPSTGAMLKNAFKKINGKKYYFNKKGRMVFGRKKIKGKWYTFDSKTGALIR